jgi:mRNA interferase MazF
MKTTTKKATARVRKASPPARAKTSSVILQARVDGNFAQELLSHDAVVLGLDGPSEVVREGLKLVHRRAQEQSLIDSYDAFYQGLRAPLPAGVAGEDAD